jgi:hypothetical protein
MSIIHDALKKVQQGQAPKANDKAATPPPAEASASSTYLYGTPEETAATHAADMPVEHLALPKNKARSILALLCAIAFIIGSFVFFYRQVNIYFPRMERSAKSWFYQLIHKKEIPEFQSKKPSDLIPLAKILVQQPSPAPLTVPAAASAATPPVAPVAAATPVSAVPAVASIPPLTTPETLNIHGVMSNGKSNVVLINDQVYQAGDDVDGVKIIKVDLDYITVDNNGHEEKIKVKN